MFQVKIKPSYIILLLLIVTYITVGLYMKYTKETSLNRHQGETKAVVTEFYSINFVFYYRYDF